jgi:hypothetical protein
MLRLLPAMTSAQRKLGRGVEQVKALQAEAAIFLDSEPYLVRVDSERRSPQQIDYRCFVTEQLSPPDHWPLLAGEAIHNLRGALDHAVSAAAPAEFRTKTQFPIFTAPAEYTQRGAAMLHGVSEAVKAIVEKAQPYRHFADGPTFDPLEQLRTLSNIDKHRVITTVVTAVRHEWIGVATGVEVSEWNIASGKPIGHGETEIASFIATGQTEIAEMQVDPGFTYEVRIEHRPLDMLKSIAFRVFEVVTEVETGQPPHPLAQYPL